MCGLSDNVDHTIFVLELGYPLELRRSHRFFPKLMQSKERLGLHTLYIKLQVILIVVPEL